jgi:hypothetical protein
MLRKWFQELLTATSADEHAAHASPPARVSTKGLFCAKPFTWFEVLGGGQRGDVYVCCQNWLSKPIGNLERQSVAEIWNGRDAQQIRRSILDGSFRYCNRERCPFLQRIDGPVQRIEDMDDARLLEIVAQELTILPFGPRDITCCFDQSCNLSCPSCRTRLIMETEHAGPIRDLQRKLEIEALQDARLLYITGSGDPFGSPFFRRWLQTMRRANMPNLERIHLHTNGLLWTPRIWASIPDEIRALVTSADVSIDAASPETYAVNRRGGDFATLIRRLQFISDLRIKGPLEWFGINMTVQANNYREMPAFVELGRRFGCDLVAFHQIMNWGTFSAPEFAARAVHEPSHPEHVTFLELLTNPAFDDPLIYLSNHTDLRRRTLARRKAAA